MTDRPDHYDERYDGKPEDVPSPSLADRLAEWLPPATGQPWSSWELWPLLDEAVEALREKDAEIGRLKNHHEATIAQTDRVLREKDAEIRRLRKAVWPLGPIGRHR